MALHDCLAILFEYSKRSDAEPNWPAVSWDALAGAGVLGWSISPKYDGLGLDTIAILEGYERLASACLTTCFLLSQREAAVRRIADMGSDALRLELLPPLARGEAFATVG